MPDDKDSIGKGNAKGGERDARGPKAPRGAGGKGGAGSEGSTVGTGGEGGTGGERGERGAGGAGGERGERGAGGAGGERGAPGANQGQGIFRGIADLSTIGINLVVATFVGLLIGIYLDKYFGTKPWLTIIFLFFGIIAGFRNIYRLARKLGSFRD